MKKFIIALFAMFSIFFATQNVKADTLPSFHDFIDSYGVAGQRQVAWPAHTNYGDFYYAVRSDDKILVVYNSTTHYVFMLSNSNFEFSQTTSGDEYDWTGRVNYRSLDSDFDALSTKFDLSGNYYMVYAQCNDTENLSADIDYDGSSTSWDNWISEFPFSPQDPNSPANNKLPMLNFTISAKSIYKFPATFDTKEILTWDYSTKSPYKDNPTNYSMEIVVSGNLNNDKTIDFSNKLLNTAHRVTLSNGGTNVAENSFSWLAFDTGKKFYGTYGWDFPPFTDNVDNSLAGYLVYVRCKDNTDSSKVSPWKIFSIDGHGIMSNVGYIQSDNEVKPKPENDPDSGSPTIAPPYSKDSSTSAESDPTGQNYNGAADYNPSTLIANLKSIVNTLQELPTLFGQVCSLMPDWLITLIYISIGMLVVIGVVKTILN